MFPQPAALDASARPALYSATQPPLGEQEWPVDLLDMDATVPDRLGGVGDFQQPARAFSKGLSLENFISSTPDHHE